MKTCFIIMPISDNKDYPNGHFNRVYEHIIKPACEIAEFKPLRADDVNTTNHIAIDIVKKIIECDMALCDLSSKNPNVLYELGIRQAFNKPVTLIKDYKTNRVFDIQGFRDLEYDENLRIDNVEEIINRLAESLTNTYKQKNTEINSLISLLGIKAAKIEKKTEISIDTELILNSILSLEKRMEKFETNNKSLGLDKAKNTSYLAISDLKKGDIVVHNRFGRGEVIDIIGNPNQKAKLKAEIQFETAGKKELLLMFAKLKKI